MKSHELHREVINSVYSSVGLSSERDLKRFDSRFSAEGPSFLTITLPTLDDLLLEGLRCALLPRFPGWAVKGSLPLFLYPLWSRVFDDKGRLLPQPCAVSIRGIRQISRFSKKIFEVCERSKVDSAISRFISIDRELVPKDHAYFSALPDICSRVFRDTLRGVTLDAVLENSRHGPGAVAEGLDAVSKYSFTKVPDRLSFYVGYETFRPFWGWLESSPPLNAEIPARLCAVPKTASKPRLISIEPSYNQFLQQGIHSILRRGLDRLGICQYSDSLPNRELARKGSIDSSLATIDLSDASDRVSYALFRHVFNRFPLFTKLCLETRSDLCDTGMGVISLRKFASMGSAVTFPVETIVFTCILILSIMEKDGLGLKDIDKIVLRPDLRVFGDDIVCPTEYVPNLLDNLDKFGLVVNESKSFWQGHFRESCGGDFFRGVDVTPHYLRTQAPSRRHHVKEIISLSSLRNRFEETYGETPFTVYCDRGLSGILGFYPEHPDPEQANCVAKRGPGSTRYNRALQRHEHLVWVPSYSRKASVASDYATLFAAIHKITPGEFSFDSQRITHDARPYVARLKRRWVETA